MIEINNLTQNEIDQGRIKKIIENVLEQEGAKGTEVSLAFLGPGRMRKLNKQYRGQNKVTDVLAFSELEVPFEKFKIGKAQKHQGLGEIVICLREVKKNAKKSGNSFEKELALVLIHGTLHLLGYDHEKSNDQAEKMELKEKQFLKNL